LTIVPRILNGQFHRNSRLSRVPAIAIADTAMISDIDRRTGQYGG
jgi:hypothetical protein